MAKGCRAIADAVFSPYTLTARGVMAMVAILYINGVIDMGMIDVSNYGIPEDYMPFMLAAALILGLLTAIGLRRYFHDKAATKAGYENPYDMAYDKRYDFGTVVGFLLGSAAGMYMAPAVTDAVFTGAGQWTFVLCAALSAALMVVIITTMIHFGLRKWVIKTKEYYESVVDDIKDLVDTVTKPLDDAASAEPAVIPAADNHVKAKKG